ncbi:hypothetical protein Acor_32370 [Acrocarpospora corrugata]|uniref:Secreted protein n=1 Tax=Acrocarpospora corrugata TaxID=35763 RepID=A0A5M3W1H1_9ACTN|nr:hypothetical protein [Acrocarpospora corrugata]GES01173.1 hypothetical protein Acor_32370 [Acrocarpospora corrugata]
MRIRKILGLTAVTAILTVGVSGVAATTANASPAKTQTVADSPHDWGYEEDWGSYYSHGGKAKAKGWIDVDYSKHEDNKVRVSGSLYDLDHRGSKCAFVKFRTNDWDGHEFDWDNFWSYKECGWKKSFKFTKYDVSQIQVQVCQINKHGGAPYKCKGWNTIYSAWDDHYGYDWDYDHDDDHDDHHNL